MRCLVVADLHYSLPQFDWLLAAAPEFDLVIFAGDALDVGSFVDFRAQIVVVKKYLALLSGVTRVMLCSGNHDLDERSPEGEKVSHWVGEISELGIACDGDSLAIGDTLFTVCPWWDGPLVKAAHRCPVARGRRATAGAMDLGSSCATGEFAGELGRQAILRRCRTRAMDRALPALDGDLGPCAPVALHPRRLVVRPARRTWVFNTGLQPGRPPVYIVLDIDEGAAFWLPAGDAQCIDLQRAAAAAGRADHKSAAVAHILGSDCRSDPGETCIGGRLIMLCRISPTMARWVPWPAY